MCGKRSGNQEQGGADWGRSTTLLVRAFSCHEHICAVFLLPGQAPVAPEPQVPLSLRACRYCPLLERCTCPVHRQLQTDTNTLCCLCCPFLQLWEQALSLQHLKEHAFIELPGGEGRVSVLDLINYVQNNPELKALVDKDPNLVLPKEGMTRWGRAGDQLSELISI